MLTGLEARVLSDGSAWELVTTKEAPNNCRYCKHFAYRHADHTGREHFCRRSGVCLVLAKSTDPNATSYGWACKGAYFERVTSDVEGV